MRSAKSLLAAFLVFPLVAFGQNVTLKACDRLFTGHFEAVTGAGANARPTADAGANVVAEPGSAAQLQGTGSDPEGQSLTYCWRVTDDDGQTLSFDDPGRPDAELYSSGPGRFSVQLTVDDGVQTSVADSLVVDARTVTQTVGASGAGLSGPADSLAFDFSPGAVANDTEITISKLHPDEYPAELQGQDVVAVFDMSPSGQQFSAPVNVSMQVPNSGGDDVVPLIWLSLSDQGVELIPNQQMSVTDDGIGVSGTVEHFSRLFLLRLNPFVINHDRNVFAFGSGRFTASYSARFNNVPDGASIRTRKVGAFANAPQLLPPLLVTSPVSQLRYEEDLEIVSPLILSDRGTIAGECDDSGVARVGVELEISREALNGVIGGFTVANLNAGVSQLVFNVRCFGGFLLPSARNDTVALPFGQLQVRFNPFANDDPGASSFDFSATEIVTPPTFGGVSINASGIATYSNTGPFVSDSFQYRAKTVSGVTTGVATVTIRRNDSPNQVPVAIDDSFSVSTGLARNLAILANDIDSDGALDASSVSLDLNQTTGSVTLNADGTVGYFTTAPNGTDRFRYRVTDNSGAQSNFATVTISIVGAVRANDDSADTLQDTAVDIDVLSNDENFDPATILVDQAPIRGTAVVASDNMGGPPFIRYTPNAGIADTDFFFYSIGDGTGRRDQARVSIAIRDPNNQKPIARPDAASTLVDTPVIIQVGINDDDPDGLLTFGSEEVVDPPSNGTANAAQGGPGGILYTPSQGFSGTDTFTYRIADAQDVFSDPAQVTVTVTRPVNQAPIANDDSVVTAINVTTRIQVLANDRDPDGALDETTVNIISGPGTGTADVQNDGTVVYTPASGFVGSDTFRYTVMDTMGGTSNAATVTVDVRNFVGANARLADNISAAQVHFFSLFAGQFIQQGVGTFVGLFHTNADTIGNITPLSDYTIGFGILNTDPGSDDDYDFSTPGQDFSASFSPTIERYVFDGLTAQPLFNGLDRTLTVTGSMTGVTDSIDAPPSVVDQDGDLNIIRGDFNGLRTVVEFPDSDFTHMVVRMFTLVPNQPIRGVLARIPKSAMSLDAATGRRFRPILDEATISAMNQRGLVPTDNVAVVFYNQKDTTDFFPDAGQRPVPLAAGVGFSIPPEQLVESPKQCEILPSPPTLCATGSNETLLAANANGDVTMHSPVDGTFLGRLIGETAPNFSVLSGWHIVQDPVTQCLLFSDGQGDKIVRYDTNGRVMDDPFIDDNTTPLMVSPRGMAFDGDDLLVTTLNDVLRFDSAGNFLGTEVADAGRPNALLLEPDGDLLVSDQSGSNFTDTVYVEPFDGSPRSTVVGSLGTPYQIERQRDGNNALAHFAGNEIRFFNSTNPSLTSIVLGLNDSGSPRRPRGVAGLENGSFLVTADAGTGVATVDPNFVNGTNTLTTLVTGSTFRFISRICRP